MRFPHCARGLARASILTAAIALTGCGEPGIPSVPTEAERTYGEWVKIELPGTICGNGSQYKFWVNWSETSDNLAIMLEPGGACWDYDSCTGKNGVRGAANPDGIRDTLMGLYQHAFPFTRRTDEENAVRDWNLVFLPYCTGDIHAGDRVANYADASGAGPQVEFHHSGHENMIAVTEWLAGQVKRVPRMLVTGCSAGGAGALSNYYTFRTGLPVDRGYLLNDSGPIFPSLGYSGPMHKKIRESWGIDEVLQSYPFDLDPNDLGTINTALADRFPDDRLSITYFLRDYNYSVYSYERFYEPHDKDSILAKWAADTKLLTDLYDTRKNLAYFIPYWRKYNKSHCGTLIDYAHTEIQEAGVDLGDFVDLLLDDERPLKSYMESPQPGEDVNP